VRWEKVIAAEIPVELGKANGRLHLLISFLSKFPSPALVKDRSSRILAYNLRAQKLLDLEKSSIGKELHQVLGITDARMIRQLRQQDRSVFTHGSARVFFNVPVDLAGKPSAKSFSLLQFTFADSDDDPLLVSFITRPGAKP
jgi:PAS domain-containing protein